MQHICSFSVDLGQFFIVELLKKSYKSVKKPILSQSAQLLAILAQFHAPQHQSDCGKCETKSEEK